MPNFEGGAQRKKIEANVWGSDGEYAKAGFDDDVEFQIAAVPDRPAANESPLVSDVGPRREYRRSVETDETRLAELLGDARLELTENPTSSSPDLSDTDPSAPTPEQVRTTAQIYTSDRFTNLGRVAPREGMIGTPTEAGEVPGSIQDAAIAPLRRTERPTTPAAQAPSATEYFGERRPWKEPSRTERPPLKKKPFYKRWLGL